MPANSGIDESLIAEAMRFVIEEGFTLLHSDRDFEPFEKHLGLNVVSQENNNPLREDSI